jgi:signal transduction histidine kinase
MRMIAMPPSKAGAPARSTDAQALARFAASLWTRLGGSRVGFTAAVCALISTQALFQPSLYEPFVPEAVARAWFDYLGECLLMGVPIMVAVTTVETLAPGRPRWLAVPVVAVALGAGAIVGALALIPYYDLPPESAFDERFVSDVVYWMLIAGGMVLIYAMQRRAAVAAATAHEARVHRVALGKQMLEAQLQVMRAQIEPHFLFNTLANVKRLAQTDGPASLAMLDNLTRYLQAALPRMRDEHTTLGQEADLVQAYLEVLRIRMGLRLRFEIDVPAGLRGEPFPPMLLLTLIENAVKHGLGPSPQGGTITLRAERTTGGFVVRVADNGIGFGDAVSGGSGVGLANSRARLAALYGDAATLELAANDPSGVIATVQIPGGARAEQAARESAVVPEG